ncbi:MAG: fused MFS/spermidine synthase [Coriobacteriia bacterium]|nr:fused MFS/spermidine synthase [Coriobacteriia bacterium]
MTLSHQEPDIRVIERGAIRILQVGRVQQSSMYLDAPFETDFDYPGYLHLTVAVKPDAVRVCMVGLGGGTVAKRMWRDYPQMTIEAVELDSRIADIAHTSFALPCDERLRVHVAEGRGFLEKSHDTYDIIIVDAFDDERVPMPLMTEEFHRIVLARLSEDGVFAYNMHGSVTGDRSHPFRRLYRTLRVSFAHVWPFLVGISRSSGGPASHSEIIILATNARLTTEELRARIASRVDGRVSVPEFHEFGRDLYDGPIRGGDVASYCDSRA